MGGIKARGVREMAAVPATKKKKKYKYLQPCMERRNSFTPMVYSADEITGTKAIAAHQSLVSLISNKLKWEYLEMCGFIRAWMSLVIVISNTLILSGARDK